MSYTNTCEVETAMVESTLARAKRSNILPLLLIGHETLLTFFWADNFDHKVETQQRGKMVNTTYLMAFHEAIEDTNEDTTVNTSYVNSTLDVGAALNAFKFLWNGVEQFQNVLIHLRDFHFMKKIFRFCMLRKTTQALYPV